MAYYRKRGSSWSYTIDVGQAPRTGKRKQKTKGGYKTKKEAQLAAGEVQKKLADKTYIEESDMIFSAVAKEWLARYSDSVKVSSVRIRENEIAHLNHYFEMLPINTIKKRAYQSALTDLKKRGYAENTISGVHGTGRMIFQYAVEFDLITDDPTAHAKVPKTQQTVEDIEQEEDVPSYLEKEQLALFLKTAQEKGMEDDYEIFLTLAYTGMRAGELCALKEKDLDSKENTIRITKTYYNPKNNIKEYDLLPPKTKTSIRTLEVDPLVIKALDRRINKQKPIKMKFRKTYHDKGFVFTGDKYLGYPIYIKFIENRMARLLKLSGLQEDLTPHSLRHTHTSLLAEAGVSLEAIMERLGHTDDDTTRKVYLHVTKPMKKEASHKFSELMRSLN